MVPYGKTAIVEYKGTFDNGEIFDSTEGIEPLEYEVGSGRVINGFDEAVHGMEVGEVRKVRISPGDAYGEYDESRVERGLMAALPNAQNIEINKTFYFVTREGLKFPARVTEINEGVAVVDFNHPLAGKALNFEIKLVGVKD